MTETYIQILQNARTTVIWEIVLISIFFAVVTVGVFLIPYEVKTKNGMRNTFLRMGAKWQLWVLKGCFAALLIGGCLWIDCARGNQIKAIDADIAQQTVISCQTEYAVEQPLFALGKRRTVWISKDGEEVPLTQYGSSLSSGDVGIGTVVYGEYSGIVLSVEEG